MGTKGTIRAVKLIALAVGVWAAAAASFAQEQDIPAPAHLDPAGVQSWFEHYIHADGWSVLGADRDAVALAAPGGVPVMGDGTLMATIRHEYYAPREIGGQTMRSMQQIRFIDCQRRMNRIVSMTIFAKSNLQGAHATRETPGAEWIAPQPDSLYLAAMERICATPHQATPRN